MKRVLIVLLLGAAVAAAAWFFSGGGDVDLEGRFVECRERVAEDPRAEESLDCFTAESVALVTGLLEQKRFTSGRLDYLKRYTRLLDFDDVVGEPEQRDTVARLEVARGRKRATVLFRLEEGEWRIDVKELPGFWLPLDQLAAP